MTDYKRLTEKMGGIYFSNCDNCPSIALCNYNNCCGDVMIHRLGELEDKIESGELVLKKEVLKEFAEKLKSKKTVYDNGGDGDLRAAVPIEAIDELLKEYEEQLDEFADCKTCPAWSGSDCTRNPYTEGCLKEETK